jgi:hypothetical protein
VKRKRLILSALVALAMMISTVSDAVTLSPAQLLGTIAVWLGGIWVFRRTRHGED